MDLIFHVYSVVCLLIQYVLPVILMTYFYWMVAKTIWARRDICEMIDGSNHRFNKELQMLKSKRKVSMSNMYVGCSTAARPPSMRL